MFGLRADDGNKVTITFEERNFIDTEGRERLETLPLYGRGDPAVKDAEEASEVTSSLAFTSLRMLLIDWTIRWR
jgi:hypothetical protein